MPTKGIKTHVTVKNQEIQKNKMRVLERGGQIVTMDERHLHDEAASQAKECRCGNEKKGNLLCNLARAVPLNMEKLVRLCHQRFCWSRSTSSS